MNLWWQRGYSWELVKGLWGSWSGAFHIIFVFSLGKINSTQALSALCMFSPCESFLQLVWFTPSVLIRHASQGKLVHRCVTQNDLSVSCQPCDELATYPAARTADGRCSGAVLLLSECRIKIFPYTILSKSQLHTWRWAFQLKSGPLPPLGDTSRAATPKSFSE